MDADTFLASFAFNRGRSDYLRGRPNPFPPDSTESKNWEAGLETAASEFDEDIDEALFDAVCDGEGRASARHVRHHLAKRGYRIVKIES